MKARISASLLTLLAAACSAETASPPDQSLRVISGTPSSASSELRERLEGTGELRALIVSGDKVFAATEHEIYEIEGGALAPRRRFDDGTRPSEPGTIHRLASRATGGVYAATDGGLFVVDSLYATPHPIQLPGPLLAVAESTGDDMGGTWLGTSTGLFRLRDSLEQIEVAGLDAAFASQIATNGQQLVAWLSDRLIEIGQDEAGLFSIDRGFSISAVYDMDTAGETIFVASEEGLFRLRSSEDPPWSQFELGGAAALGVSATASGGALVRTHDAVIEVRSDDVQFRYAIGAISGPAPIASVSGSELWTVDDGGLVRIGLSDATAATSFRSDLEPWLQQHCSACHASQTQNFLDPKVFAALAEDALSRVSRGDMPRCAGGLPCPESEQLAGDDYEVLERWIRDGKQP